MFIEVSILVIAIAVFVTASVSLSYANSCTAGNLTIVKNTNYFLMCWSAILMVSFAFIIYQEYTKGTKLSHQGEDIVMKLLPTLTLVSGVIIGQFGLIQYAALSNVACGGVTQTNLQNCYSVFMALGVILFVVGGLLIYWSEKITDLDFKVPTQSLEFDD